MNEKTIALNVLLSAIKENIDDLEKIKADYEILKSELKENSNNESK